MDARDLDALVAGKVMGLKVVGLAPCMRVPGDWYATGKVGDAPDINDELEPVFENEWGRLEPVEEYSTDIAAAFMVVERLRTTKDALMKLAVFADGETAVGCEFYLNEHAPYVTPPAAAGADTPARAICLAALRAVGVEP